MNTDETCSTRFRKGDKVCYSSDGRIGEITGRYFERRDAWEVCFGGVELLNVPAEKLSPVNARRNVYDLFQDGEFLSISDFRRRMYKYRMSGELTNMMYSMDNSVAEFLPHQFIPVVKFLESYTDRLLIADEVGLGKTIEAMYIWEELKARKNAKRLLVVVPAVLRDKWRGDMRKFFGIDAHIVSAQGNGVARSLLSCIRDARHDPARTSFALIVSLEGVRCAEDVKASLSECQDVEDVFDMTVIDEAHYLRNPETVSYKMGALLRDVSRHMVLLSATPLQTSSDNFFSLLSLLAPEDFSHKETFDAQLMENMPLVKLANALEGGGSKDLICGLVDAALRNEVFADDADLRRLSENIDSILDDQRERVLMTGKVKGKYFYSGLVTRSRKRDVFPDKTHRNVVSVNFKLNEYEKSFYDDVSEYLREEDSLSGNGNKFSTFSLIARQRQMASCIPAALRTWRGMDDDEDFNLLAAAEDVERPRPGKMPLFPGFDLAKLEDEDSKFNKVLAKIKEILASNPQEKVVVFSFFRNTVKYLHARLVAAGVSSSYIIGGLTLEEKTDRIRRFSESGINVLVSSEVGSEGIDLQFARYELNYDIPWNPMRLEQRIGRIDRIGQKSSDIYICNAYCENTIEDRILSRLYSRIEVFRNVIGDLEEIMGDRIRNLEVDVFRGSGDLDEGELAKRAEDAVHAICARREMARNLEFEAANMASPYQNFVLQNISDAYKARRLMTTEELMFFCHDVLQEKFPGSSVVPVAETSVADVRLSEVARRELSRFIVNNPSAATSQLNVTARGLRCNFGRKLIGDVEPSAVSEYIDVNHPVVKWLLSVVSSEDIFSSGCDIVSLKSSQLPEGLELSPGYYAFGVQRWCSSGVRNVNELRFYAASGQYCCDEQPMVVSGGDAESLMISVVLNGDAFDVNLLAEEDYNACGRALSVISSRMEDDFCSFESEQRTLNENLAVEQSRYVTRTAAIKAGKIQSAIEKLESALAGGCLTDKERKQRQSLIKANEKRRAIVLESRDARLATIRERQACAPVSEDVAIGVICVTEG